MFWNRSGEPAAPCEPVAHSGLPPQHPRVAAELAAMRELQGARAAMERATRLHADALRLKADATAQFDYARREVRRIVEAKPAP